MTSFPRALLAPCALGAALLLAPSAPARAQSAAPAASPSPSPASEIGRVGTSDRQDEPFGATSRTTYVVTKEQMLLHGDDTVAAALERVPGVLIQRYGAAGAQATVSIRGQRGDGVLVLLDGRPAAGTGIGATDVGAMPTAGIERIEIVEGAGATLYGNGASAGVIDIITTRSRAAYRTPVASLAGGSLGYGRAALETSWFSFSREIAANAYDVPLAGFHPNPARINADLSSTNARVSESGAFGDLRVSGSAGFSSRILGVPGSLNFPTIFARQNDDTFDARVALALVHPHATTTLDLSGVRERLVYQDLDANETLGFPFLNYSSDARVQASLRNNVVSDANRLIYGIDLARGVARNDAGNDVFSVTPYAQAALYAQNSFAFANGSRIYAGLRAERDGGAGGAISPALGGTLALGGGFALRVNAGTAFRVPTAVDLTYPGFSNPALVPERMQSFDATIDAHHALGGASLGWFVQTARDLIALNPNVDFTQPFGTGNEPLINEQQSSVAGFVLDVATKSYAGMAARVSVTDTYRALGYNRGFEAQRLAGRPVFSASVDLGYTGPPHAVLAALGAVARSVGALDTATAGNYTTVDGYARFRVAPHALLSFRVFDLGNARYEEFTGYPMPGRTFAVELSTR